ncbi:MAG: DUF4271 domain-containing protein [Tannerellaceae bacterium]|jgi:hypothetical protein|nr:DUF4271 domain-containing protein [Tannerellaceae bacterium]
MYTISNNPLTVYDLPSIPIGHQQSVYDLALLVIFALFIAFAFLYYFRRDQFFPLFFPIQACFLTAVFATLIVIQSEYFAFRDASQLIGVTFLIFVFVYVFYLFKQGFYVCLGWVFACESELAEWRQHYQLLSGYWSISLYLTTAYCIVSPLPRPVILFATIFVIYRLVLLYRTAQIFSVNGAKYFLLILYFCAQDVTPLLFLYKGVFWLLSSLEERPLW